MGDEIYRGIQETLTGLGFALDSSMGRSTQKYTKRSDDGDLVVLVSLRTNTKYYSAHMKRRVYAGHRLVIEKHRALKTRLTSLPRAKINFFNRWMFQRLGMQSVDIPAPEFSNLSFFASENSWAIKFLSNSRTKDLLPRLLMSAEKTPNVVFGLNPDQFVLTTTRSIKTLTPDFFNQILREFQELVEVAFEVEPPKESVSLTRFEIFCRAHPVALVVLLFAAFLTLSTVGALTIFFAAIAGIMPYLVFGGLAGYFFWRKAQRKRRTS